MDGVLQELPTGSSGGRWRRHRRSTSTTSAAVGRLERLLDSIARTVLRSPSVSGMRSSRLSLHCRPKGRGARPMRPSRPLPDPREKKGSAAISSYMTTPIDQMSMECWHATWVVAHTFTACMCSGHVYSGVAQGCTWVPAHTNESCHSPLPGGSSLTSCSTVHCTHACGLTEPHACKLRAAAGLLLYARGAQVAVPLIDRFSALLVGTQLALTGATKWILVLLDLGGRLNTAVQIPGVALLRSTCSARVA